MRGKSAAVNLMIAESCSIVYGLVQSLFLNLQFQLKVAALWTAQIAAVLKVGAAYPLILKLKVIFLLIIYCQVKIA